MSTTHESVTTYEPRELQARAREIARAEAKAWSKGRATCVLWSLQVSNLGASLVVDYYDGGGNPRRTREAL